MVNAIMMLLLSWLPARAEVYGSGYPKDTTTAWCSTIPYPMKDQVYRCYPNPWGSGSIFLYVRFPDSAGISGCLRGASNLMEVLQPGKWIFIGGGAPYLPKLTLDQDQQCLDRSGVVNQAKQGDSLDIEFWFTPSDTLVADTVRGSFKVFYRGQILPPNYVPVQRRESRPMARWTASGLFVQNASAGPYQLRDLRGRSVPLRSQMDGSGVRLTPLARVPGGLYRLTWPDGATAVLLPGD